MKRCWKARETRY